MNAAVLRRAALVSLAFAVPLAGAWTLALSLFEDHPGVLRWAGVAIYTAALLGAVWVGRRLRQG